MARGKDAIRESFGDFLTRFRISDARITGEHYLDLESTSVGWGIVEFTATPNAGGEPVKMRARFTSVSARRGDHWVFISDHASLPMP